MALRLGNGVIINTTSGTGTPVTGFLLPIGDPNTGDGDGSLDDGAIPLTETMSVSNAIDKINEFMLKLVPASPVLFPSASLTGSNYLSGTLPLLCSGVIPDNTNGGTLPSVSDGDDVSLYRGSSSTFSSNMIEDSGKGDSGSIAVYYNNTKGGELFFTAAIGDSIDSNGLEVTDNNWYPLSQPNFHQSFDASVKNAPVLDGWNRYLLSYIDDQAVNNPTNEVYLLKDNLSNTASYISGALSEGVSGTFAYSSGIPHYQSGATLTMTNATLNDLSGYAYINDDPLEISSVDGTLFDSPQTVDYSTLGIITPLAVNTTGNITSFDMTLNASNSHGQDNLRFRARNVNGYSVYNELLAVDVLYMNGTTNGLDETARVDLGIGNTITDAPQVIGGLPASPTPFPSSQTLADPLYTSEAVIVGGVLRHDIGDYSTGYLPVGLNYSGKKIDSQYVDFVISEPSKSNITINIDGTYSGIWIGLEGYSDDVAICPNSTSFTWWDGFVAYNGSGLPGRAGASEGCADGILPTGTSGSYTMTFGTANTSKNSNGTDAVTTKNIFVRLKLAAGESITSLTFG